MAPCIRCPLLRGVGETAPLLHIREHLFSLLTALSIGPDMFVLVRKTPVFGSGGACAEAPPKFAPVRDSQAPEPVWRAAAAMLFH